MPRIHEALILELERRLTEGEARPGIVDAAYNRLINEWAGTVTEDDRLLLHISKLLLEFEVSFLGVQAELIKSLITHRIVDNWGKENVLGWQGMDDKQKSTLIAGHLAQKKALAKAREIFDAIPAEGGTASNYRRDVPDPVAFKGQILRSFLESFT